MLTIDLLNGKVPAPQKVEAYADVKGRIHKTQHQAAASSIAIKAQEAGYTGAMYPRFLEYLFEQGILTIG